MSLRLHTPKTYFGTFDNLNHGLFSARHPRFSNTPVDILENEDNYLLLAELPGFEKDQISVSIEGKTISIEAIVPTPELKEEITEESEETDESEELIEDRVSILLQERFVRNIKKQYKFDKLIDANQSSVEYVNGVLQIILAKSEESKPVKLSL